MKRNYYLSLFNTKAFKEKPFTVLFRSLSLLFLDIFKIKKKFNIKHDKINFNFLYLPGFKKKSGGRGLYIYKEKIEDLMEFGHQFIKKDNHCIDGGANQGIFSLSFASVVGNKGKIIAVEPFDYCINILKNNAKENEFNNIIIEQKVLFSKSDLEKKLDYTDGVGAASITRNFGKKNFLNVKTITIDDLVKINNIKPNFIKLDIEGAEFEALQGSLNTLSFHEPNICLECTDEQEFFKINELLKRFNYQPYVFIDKKLTKLNNFKSYGNIFFLK